jgi:hypothetical protein
MRHVGLLVGAVVVVATAVPAAARPPVPVQDPGTGIDATGASDVTANLQALIDRTLDGGTVRLKPGADYRMEGTLLLEERHNLRIEGNGARIFATTRDGSGTRHRHLRIVGGADVVVSRLEIQGANPYAGLDDRGYVPELEGQHGISLEGVTDVELDRVHIHDTYGDLVYISRHEGDRRWSERVWIHDSTLERSGRQGVTVGAGRDIVIERNRLTDMRRATVDLEPTTPSWGADNVHILDNEVGPGRLLFVAAAGDGPVNRVVIARNRLQGRALSFWMLAEEGERRQRAWVVDNTSDVPMTAPPLRFSRVDGVIVHGNRQSIDETGALVRAEDSCDVAITDNDIAPGTRLAEGPSRQCNFILPVRPPEPPQVAGRALALALAEAAPPPTTEPAPTTTAAPPTTTSTTPRSTPNEPQLATSDTQHDDGVAWPVVVLAMVLTALAGAGTTLALSSWRARR